MNNYLKPAFTLVELLVVIAIIGILSGLIIVGMAGMTDSARLAKSQAFASSLRNSLLANLTDEWKLDGNAIDSWGINNGTITDAVSLSSGCVYGSCLSFDGDDDHIDFGSNASLVNIFNAGNSFTYSVWFNPSVIPASAWHWILCKAYTSHASPYYQFDLILYPTGYVANRIVNNAGGVYIPSVNSSAGSISPNKWYFAVASIDTSANIQKLYLNGTLVESRSGATGTYANYSTPLTAGADKNLYSSSTYNFTGKLDEIRLYSTVIPVSQIKEQYFAGLNRLFSGDLMTKQEYLDRIYNLHDLLAKK